MPIVHAEKGICFKKRELFFEDWFAHKGTQGKIVYRQKMIHANRPQIQD